jgi:hypothetical protein
MDNLTQERLASLEAKLEFMKDLLKEIRDDIKDRPSRSEHEELKTEVEQLRSFYSSLMWKVATGAGSLSVLTALIVEFIANYFR